MRLGGGRRSELSLTDRLLRLEQARFDELLEGVAPRPGATAELQAAVAALAAARGDRA